MEKHLSVQHYEFVLTVGGRDNGVSLPKGGGWFFVSMTAPGGSAVFLLWARYKENIKEE